MRRLVACVLTLVLGLGLTVDLPAAPKRGEPAVRELRVQTVGDVTYFHVRLDVPRDLATAAEQQFGGFFPAPTPSLAPRLVPADAGVRLVCQRVDRNRPGGMPFGAPPGVWNGSDDTNFLSEGPPTPAAGGKVEDMGRQAEEIERKGPPARAKEPPRSAGKPVLKKVETKQAAGKAEPRPRQPRQPVPVQGLEFVGRCDPAAAAKVKLLYAVPSRPLTSVGRLVNRPRPPVWREVELVLDFPSAAKVPVPAEAAERGEKPRPDGGSRVEPPVRDDLEGLWAVARVDALLGQAAEAADFGFYNFAASSTARRYGVQGFAAPGMNRFAGGPPFGGGEFIDHQLYETTTGAAAITESLQTRRMNAVGPRRDERRTVAVDTIRGIDIAEHPWQEMMGDRKPAPEPFARMVPRDNYYVHFKRLDKFVEFTDLLEQWGTNLIRAYELTSRDYRLKQRYEQQLCLRSTELGRALGPLVIKGIAITGNDPYVREGTDVAILFQVLNKDVFLAAVEPFLAEARRKYGGKLAEDKADYHGVSVESFVTPLREVSLYRAGVGDVVVYANSPVGVRRVLDAAAGRGQSLADSLDFRYMRTVFRYDDGDEDGFAFLSDPFIRNLVGPAGKIKEKRRLEALASLQMLSYGAMLASGETGKVPDSAADVCRAAGLLAEEVPVPEGRPAAWSPGEGVAVSDAYNTLHFATPLVELPVDKVTPTEAAEYQRFRMEYLGLWRQFFDPIGMRVSLRDGRVRLDTYILPLIENSAYNRLRALTGKGTVHLDPSRLSPKTLFQYVMHLSTDATERGSWFGLHRPVRGPGEPTEFALASVLAWAADPVGEWFLVRIDESPNYERLLRLAERMSRADKAVDIEEVARLVWTLPVAVGVDVKNPMSLAAALATARTAAMLSLPGALTWTPLEKEYKGVSIVRVGATPAGMEMVGQVWGELRRRRSDPFLPALYYAVVGGGLYVTLNEEMMHSLIDGVQPADKAAGVEVNTSLYVAPGAAEPTKALLKRVLEWQTHEQARRGLPVWQALYDCGLVAKDAPADEAAAAAYRYLGFVPVSPDGAGYRYDRKSGEVTNARHGSYRVPSLHTTTADDSPLNRLLETVRSVRADLRFREDGIHTVLTLDRGKGKE